MNVTTLVTLFIRKYHSLFIPSFGVKFVPTLKDTSEKRIKESKGAAHLEGERTPVSVWSFSIFQKPGTLANSGVSFILRSLRC